MSKDNEGYGSGYKPSVIEPVPFPFKLLHTGLNVEEGPTDIEDGEAVDMSDIRIVRGGIAPVFMLGLFPVNDVTTGAHTPVLHITSFEKAVAGTKIPVRMYSDRWEWFNGSAWVAVPGAVSGDATQRLYTTVMDDKLIAANGKARVMSWDGNPVNSIAAISAETPSAFFVTRIGQRLMVAVARAGTSGDFDRHGIAYSADGDIAEWTDVAAGASGTILTLKPEGTATIANFITGLSNLERGTVIYRQRSIVLASRTGVRIAPFRFATIDFGHGTESPYSIANGGLAFGDFFLGFDYVVYHFDGQSPPVPIGLPIQRRLEERIGDLKHCVGYINPVNMTYNLLSPRIGQPAPQLGDMHTFSIRDYIRQQKLSWSYRPILTKNITTGGYLPKVPTQQILFVDSFNDPINDLVDPSNPPQFSLISVPASLVGLRTAFGGFQMGQAISGRVPNIIPTPDRIFSDSNFANYSAIIDYARTNDAKLIPKWVGGSNTNVTDPVTGNFSVALWKAKWKTFTDGVIATPGLEQKFKDAVRDGIIIGTYTMDDFVNGGAASSDFNAPITFEELEGPNGIFPYAKGIWPWMPLGVRARTSEMYRWLGVDRQYLYLDFCICQWKCGLSGNNGAQYATDMLLRGDACGLSVVGGMNLLNQGCGNTAGWGCKRGCTPTECGMSPAEIINIAGGQLDNPRVAHMTYWAYGSGSCGGDLPDGDYFNRPEIKAAFQTVWDTKCQGRTAGPINIRGDLVAP